MKAWKTLQSQEIWSRPWFSLRVERVETSRGAILEDYPLIESRDWACIVAVTKEQEIVLARQYRHGVRAVTLEFPAGGVDTGEAPLAAAERELKEETGYAAPRWDHLLSVFPEPTRRSHQAHLFLARDAYRSGDQALEPGEDVSVELFDAERAEELALQLSHAVHIAALFLALQKLRGRRP